MQPFFFFFCLQSQNLKLTAALFPERLYCDKNKYKNTACSCISSHLVSESLLVVLITSLLNKNISILNVLGERKEREKLLSSE